MPRPAGDRYSCRCWHGCRRCCHLAHGCPIPKAYTAHPPWLCTALWGMGPTCRMGGFHRGTPTGRTQCISAFLCPLDALDFYSDDLGHSFVLLMGHQPCFCSCPFQPGAVLFLSPGPLCIPHSDSPREHPIGLTHPVWAESSC